MRQTSSPSTNTRLMSLRTWMAPRRLSAPMNSSPEVMVRAGPRNTNSGASSPSSLSHCCVPARFIYARARVFRSVVVMVSLPFNTNDPRPPQNCAVSSANIEPVQAHHLSPGRREVARERFARVRAAVHLGHRAQLRAGPEDQVDARTRPPHLAGLAVAPFEHARVLGRRLPLGAHVQQVHEEVVGQRARP